MVVEMQHEQDRNAEELSAAKDAAAKAAEALAAAEARAAEVETRAKSEAVKLAARTMENNAALVGATPLVTTTPGPTSAAAKMVSAADQRQIGLQHQPTQRGDGVAQAAHGRGQGRERVVLTSHPPHRSP